MKPPGPQNGTKSTALKRYRAHLETVITAAVKTPRLILATSLLTSSFYMPDLFADLGDSTQYGCLLISRTNHDL